MRNGERGASQIPLVICIVLLLAAAGWGYSQYSELESVKASLDGIRRSAQDPASTALPSDEVVKKYIAFARGDGALYKQRLEEVGEVTGGRETEENLNLLVSPTKLRATVTKVLESLDKGEFTVEYPVNRFIEDPNGGIKVQEGAGKVTVQYGGTRELRGAKPDMTAVLDYVVVPAMRRMVADIKRYRDAYDAAVNAKETAEAGYRRDLDAKDGEIRAKVEEQAALENRKNQEVTDLRRQLGEAEAAKTAAEDEKTKAVAALTAERNQWKSRAEEAASSVQVLKQRKRDIEIDTSPDGSILSVGDRFAVIDIGRGTNNLMAGTNFDVYAIGKGGMEIPKGVVKVLKTDAGQSSCAVVEQYDAFNPIVPGDKIRTLLYSPKETIHVAMVGRFQKMGKSDAARRLTDLGVVVDDKVTINTTYLVVGSPENDAQPIEETPEYKSATLFGIPVITEKELSKFTMY